MALTRTLSRGDVMLVGETRLTVEGAERGQCRLRVDADGLTTFHSLRTGAQLPLRPWLPQLGPDRPSLSVRWCRQGQARLAVHAPRAIRIHHLPTPEVSA